MSRTLLCNIFSLTPQCVWFKPNPEASLQKTNDSNKVKSTLVTITPNITHDDFSFT